jgi:hypothetical protein
MRYPKAVFCPWRQAMYLAVLFFCGVQARTTETLPAAALLSLLFGSAAHGGHDHDRYHDHHRDLEGPGRHDCAMPDPTEADKARADANMIETFGMIGNDMSSQELSAIFEDVIKEKGHDEDVHSLQQSPAYSLVNIPLVYHVLTQQHILKSDATLDAVRPSATAAQLAFMTKKTNDLYSIFNRASKTSVQWASFVHNQTIYHYDLILNKDCDSLTNAEYASIINDVSEWQYMLHAIICESVEWSGVASFPKWYAPSALQHNMVRIDYRALACHDEEGNFLCEPTAGQNKSHTRWWRTRSSVLAHEFGWVQNVQYISF